MIRGRKIFLILIIMLLSLVPLSSRAKAQSPVVRAVLFYSPSCPHCQQVIEEVLPVLDQQYGSQLEIFGVNTYTEVGSALYQTYITEFSVPPEMQGVPALIVGDQLLVGSQDIPELFPEIIETGLSNGGIDWPEISGLMEAMEADTTSSDTTTVPITEPDQLTLREKFAGDLAGNILAVIVLAGMLAAVGYAGIRLSRGEASPRIIPIWLIPLFSILGLGVAGYLAYVEFNQIEAVCGPVGNCNTVQQSSYATLFGIFPVGVLGLLGYIAIMITYLVGLLDLPRYKPIFRLAMWLITLFGILFSIYLTFLEPFVIGATCLWCLSSAVIMTILFLAATWQMDWTDPEPEL